MGVIGFGFTSISAKSDEDIKDAELKIDSSPRIVNVKEKELPNMPGSKALFIEFAFNTVYEPDAGEIKFRGNVIYQSEDNSAIVKKWEKDKSFDEKTSVDIMNLIFRRCLTKAIILSEDLRLPPPIQFPRVVPKNAKAPTPEENKETN